MGFPSISVEKRGAIAKKGGYAFSGKASSGNGISRQSTARSGSGGVSRKPAAPRAGGGSRATSHKGRSRKLRIRTVYRYNPQTRRRVKVAADSPEADTWPTRKSQLPKTPGQLAALARRSAVGRAGARYIEKKAGDFGARHAPALATAAKATGVILAGVAAYYATTFILDKLKAIGTQATLADWNLQTTMGLIAARRQAEAQLGRSLTIPEKQQLKQSFDSQYEQNRIRLAADRSSLLGRIAAGARSLHITTG